MVGPELKSATEKSAIIMDQYHTGGPGGTLRRRALRHKSKDLSRMAKSPIRLNMAHPNTIFRVPVDGLKPGTTYYYTVDSTGPDGTSDGVKGREPVRTLQVEQSK